MQRFATKGDLVQIAAAARARYATQDAATTSTPGIMSAADKLKLDQLVNLQADNDTIKVNQHGKLYVDIPSLMGTSY